MTTIPESIENKIKDLPICPYLDEICDKLEKSPSRFLVLTAETAAGKSTAVPLALLNHFQGKILMLEPRRLAVTAISDRLAELLGQESGQTVGYRMHLDSKISDGTRLEVITEAILTRKIQSDPSLEDIRVVVIDEFHERSIHVDLALAFLKEAMELRDDLYVLVMSATIDYQSVAKYLQAPVIKVPGRQFPVDIVYKDNLSVVDAIKEEVCSGKNDGSILVFLPGIYEINRSARELRESLNQDQAEILVLHSSIPIKEQRYVLKPGKAGGPVRVILSSAIGETSLTVPDVSLVIDSGLARVNKTDLNVGMDKLVTENESMFSADQRSGRAGRVRSGKCIRLWNKNDVRPLRTAPEILRVDLTQLFLECAQWGVSEVDRLQWLDCPSVSAWEAAKKLVSQLGFYEDGKITQAGKAALSLGLHPRLAAVAMWGIEAIPLVVKYSSYNDASPGVQDLFARDLKGRLEKVKKLIPNAKENKKPIVLSLMAGFPDRIARLTESSNDLCIYQFPSGRKAILKRINGPEWIIAPEVSVSGLDGSSPGKIYSYEEIPEEIAVNWLNERSVVEYKSEFLKGQKLKLVKYEIRAYGAIVLKESQVPGNSEDYKEAVVNAVCENGLEWLPIDSRIENFLIRAEFLGENIEKINNLQFKTNEWLAPFINGQSINEDTVYNGLYWYLEGSQVDLKVPVQITLPNGKKRKISYEKQGQEIKPVLEVIIQQIFGCFETPKILGKPVLLKLLSPARRPLQITEDLENFWTGAWIEICKEMKGRYPKHNWDYRKVDSGE